MIKVFPVLILFSLLVPAMSFSQQVKIGYTNIEIILYQMPKAQQVEKTLATFQKKLEEQLRVKQEYAQAKLQEFLDAQEAGSLTDADKEVRMTELNKLDGEIMDFAKDSEDKLLMKREELLVPVLEELQEAIDAAASENGYTYILNQTTSAGVSTILFGPEENDITEIVMKKLGIPIAQGGQ